MKSLPLPLTRNGFKCVERWWSDHSSNLQALSFVVYARRGSVHAHVVLDGNLDEANVVAGNMCGCPDFRQRVMQAGLGRRPSGRRVNHRLSKGSRFEPHRSLGVGCADAAQAPHLQSLQPCYGCSTPAQRQRISCGAAAAPARLSMRQGWRSGSGGPWRHRCPRHSRRPPRQS